jgi:hypothetical protein
MEIAVQSYMQDLKRRGSAERVWAIALLIACPAVALLAAL